ncbi:MAG TPA: hypothetical protein VF861_13385 [Telluria sp.]
MTSHSKKPIKVYVYDQPESSNSRHPVSNASVSLYRQDERGPIKLADGVTDTDGWCEFKGRYEPGKYLIVYNQLPDLGSPDKYQRPVEHGANVTKYHFNVGLNARVQLTFETGKQGSAFAGRARVGETVGATVSFNGSDEQLVQVHVDPPWESVDDDRLLYSAAIHRPGPHVFRAVLRMPTVEARSVGGAAAATAGGAGIAELALSARFSAEEAVPTPISGNITVGKSRTASFATLDLALDEEIARSTSAMSFCNYMDVINKLFCRDKDGRQPACDVLRPLGQGALEDVRNMFDHIKDKRALPFIDADSYRVLKAATEAFVMVNCAVADSTLTSEEDAMLETFRRRDIAYTPGAINFGNYVGAGKDSPGLLPYLAIIRRKLPEVPITMNHEDAELCFGILQRKLTRPCMLELIWSYWHEEAMLVQTMNVITRRFQNVGSGSKLDPLANLEIDPLRPLNNLIWGYVQDEQHRLTVVRRSYEYDHQYGLRLDGRAVQNFRPADSRSRFLEAFHQLLRRLNAFYRQDDDTNVKADAFPVLNAIKEVHMILSQGAHNQFGDLPSTARVEMLMQQWLLARPEFREFLPTRIMVAYPEPWMDRVDAMKKLQGWSDISVMHFNALASFGEQLLLSIRYGAWSTLFEPLQAFNWARLWRPQVQGYIHSYRAVTGVDLTTEQPDPAADGTLPSVLLRRRLEEQARRERRP